MHHKERPLATRRRRAPRRLTLPGLALALCVAALGAGRATGGESGAATFSSGPQQVQLLELYTSQGCSSCPPAERWLADWAAHPDLWERIVPVAFHVDYWNYLGWEDPYSAAAWSARQRRHAREGGVRSVYTPGFVVNGREWRGWFSGKSPPQGERQAGVLHVAVVGDELQARYTPPPSQPGTFLLEVALLGFDLSTDVRAGENRGRELTHQFAVLAHARAPDAGTQWRMALPGSAVTSERMALAAWVTEVGQLRPLQATGGWLPAAD